MEEFIRNECPDIDRAPSTVVYACPACGRDRQPKERVHSQDCGRCGADLTLSDGLRMEALDLREKGLGCLPLRPGDAERFLQTSLQLESHPATLKGLALAALLLGNSPEAFRLMHEVLALDR